MRFLLLAIVAVVFAEDVEVKEASNDEPKPAESVHDHHHHHSFKDGLELMHHRDSLLHDRHHTMGGGDYDYEHTPHPASHGLGEPGPVILRTPGHMPHHGHPDIHAQNKIIADVYSPDYYQPTWVLDYRYLKTGGRDYTRGPGGQILILPKGVKSPDEHKQFPNFDAYLEHLRLHRLSEMSGHGHGGYYDDHYSSYGRHHGHRHHGHYSHHGHRDHQDHEHYGHHEGHTYGHHGQTMWHKYG